MHNATDRGRKNMEKKERIKEERGEGKRQVCRSYLESACLDAFPAEMIFPNDLCLVTHSLIKHTCSFQEYGR